MILAENCKTVMEIEHTFNGCRFNNGMFDFHEWTLCFEVAAKTQDESVDMDLLLAIAFAKINFVLHSILRDVFVFPIEQVELMNDLIASDTQNVFIILPFSASDDILSQALHAKLSAIVGDSIFIGELSIKNTQTKTKFYYFTPDEKYELPDQLEFVGERSLYEKPWYFRDDVDTFDLLCHPDMSDEEIIESRIEMDSKKILNEIEQTIISERKSENKKSELIDMGDIREKWNPKEV